MAKVLVVDDDFVSRETLQAIVADGGHNVDTANNGLEALQKLKAATYDLMITDIFMPGKEGLETIQEALEEQASLKVMAVTGGSTFTSYESLNWAKKVGAKETLTKPFDHDEVLAKVRKVLASSF